MQGWQPRLGAFPLKGDSCRFRLWAPACERVDVKLVDQGERCERLHRSSQGYHEGTLENVGPGDRYFFRIAGTRDRPDPASRYQPEDVHGPSQVMDASFPWEDGCWSGLPLQDYILYELHVGTFSATGTFEGAIVHLDHLVELGITAVEIMPVAQFPGERNWGYDGVHLFAPQASYGGPDGLKKLVDACHAKGLAVVLDVVYNHLGPEGNYLRDFGPYFTDRYHTPWGAALNFDGPHSDEVRRFFIENALYWITEFHMDALRLDAVHAIMDQSARPFLEDLAQAVHHQGEVLHRRVYAIAESDAGDVRLIRSPELGGYGLDAQWNDDFHHALHALLTGERAGYYHDFGGVDQVGKAFGNGYVFTGQYSHHRQRRHGVPTTGLDGRRFVVFAQNHDQTGNRMLGERLSELVSFEQCKLAAGCVLLSPFIPLLFMGEEYGETAPFQYFISHHDPALVDAVRKGRKEEFAMFRWQGEPPDPQDEATFQRCKLHRDLKTTEPHRFLYDYYRELIRLRKEEPTLADPSLRRQEVSVLREHHVVWIHRWNGSSQTLLLAHFGAEPIRATLSIPPGRWTKRLDSRSSRWNGSGSEISDLKAPSGFQEMTLGPHAIILFSQNGNASA